MKLSVFWHFLSKMGEKNEDIIDWALSKDCSMEVAEKVAVIDKYQLRELGEWQKTDLAVFVKFASEHMGLEGKQLLDFSIALRDTEWWPSPEIKIPIKSSSTAGFNN